ncbi:MAG TPA: transaldolase family protein [Polyangia bacterium]
MKLYVDSADPTEIGACVAAAGTSGVATSASLLAAAAERAGAAPRELLRAICGVANGPVRVAVAARGDDRAAMLSEARELAAVAANVVVELPTGEAGLAVTRSCAGEGIRTAIGGSPTPEQALAAARAGASYVSAPMSRTGFDAIRKLVALLRTCDATAEVVAGAIRVPTDVLDAAVAGAHAAAAPAAVLRELPAESVRNANRGGPA